MKYRKEKAKTKLMDVVKHKETVMMEKYKKNTVYVEHRRYS
jgi:hypothetical protein